MSENYFGSHHGPYPSQDDGDQNTYGQHTWDQQFLSLVDPVLQDPPPPSEQIGSVDGFPSLLDDFRPSPPLVPANDFQPGSSTMPTTSVSGQQTDLSSFVLDDFVDITLTLTSKFTDLSLLAMPDVSNDTSDPASFVFPDTSDWNMINTQATLGAAPSNLPTSNGYEAYLPRPAQGTNHGIVYNDFQPWVESPPAIQPGQNSAQQESSVFDPGSSSPTAAIASKRDDNGGLGGDFNPIAQSDKSHTPIVHGTPLLSVHTSLPNKAHPVFPFKLFNAVQSKCFPHVYQTNDNVVVSAPTGSGKTAIFELAICRLALEHGRASQPFKIVYQAPTKSLCSERVRDWSRKFSTLDLKCAELTGDTTQAELRRVAEASIIVTTPEKWDSITRKWEDHRMLVQLVKLFLIDEVHFLKDIRGATLEAVVSRMKTIGGNIRFIALSATIPNLDDIATWLGRNYLNQTLPALKETFGEEFRPVQLQKFVYGFNCNGNDWVLDKFLDSQLPPIISRHTQKKPILVFCFTKKICESTAKKLVEPISGVPDHDRPWPFPKRRIQVVNRDLQELVGSGVAFHHSGLDLQDRQAVEQGFLAGEIGLICCTSTLAVGINLPCHTVILKGTVGYTDDNLQEYSDLEVMQMLGRAGRPQFDDTATAIILTRAPNKERYEKMVSGQELIESTLHLNLIEHLNSEIALNTITDIRQAKEWLGGTFLNVRLRRNPNHYNLTGGASNPTLIDDKVEEICERDINQLKEAKMMVDHVGFCCTEYGRAMSKYMVEFSSMKKILAIKFGAGLEQMITVIAQASEFKDFRFKPQERPIFKEMSRNPVILFPIKEGISHTWHKVSLLVQSALSNLDFPDSGDAAKMRRDLIKERSMVLDKFARLEGRPNQLTQIPGIGSAGMRRLVTNNVHTVLELDEKHSMEIDTMMGRNPPFGTNIKNSLLSFPRLSLDVTQMGQAVKEMVPDSVPFGQIPTAQEVVTVRVKTTLKFTNTNGLPSWKGKWPNITLMVESTDGTLAYFWRGSLRECTRFGHVDHHFPVRLRKFEDHIVCHFSCDEIVGTIISKTLRHNIPRSMFQARERPPIIWPLAPAAPPPATTTEVDFLQDGGLDDLDFLGVEDFPGPRPESPSAVCEGLEGFPPPPPAPGPANDPNLQLEAAEPSLLPNGRYKCNHPCSGGMKKTGVACNHRCCVEGLKHKRRAVAQKTDDSGPQKRQRLEDVPGHITTGPAPLQGDVNARQPPVVVDLSMEDDDPAAAAMAATATAEEEEEVEPEAAVAATLEEVEGGESGEQRVLEWDFFHFEMFE
ncbi:hypothetical protein V8F33_004151 [Rhypophila sp. PSN 637]